MKNSPLPPSIGPGIGGTAGPGRARLGAGYGPLIIEGAGYRALTRVGSGIGLARHVTTPSTRIIQIQRPLIDQFYITHNYKRVLDKTDQ